MSSSASHKNNKLAVILPAAFINSLSLGTMSLGILFVVKDLYGASPALVGSLGAAWSLSYFVGCIVLRRITRRIRPRSSMLVTYGGSLAVFLVFMLWPGLWQAFIAYTLYGFLNAFFWPPVMGWLTKDYEGPSLSRATSYFSMSWSIGGIFSSFIAGILSEIDKLLPLKFMMGLLSVGVLFLLASRFFMKDETTTAGSISSTASLPDHSTPLRYPALLGAFLFYILMGVLFNVFPVFARDVLFLKESRVGLLLMTRAVAIALGFFILGRTYFWQFKKGAIPLLSLGSALLLVFISFQRSLTGLTISFAIVGLIQSIVYNNALFYATSGAPDRDKRVTVFEALMTAGQVSGSITGGIVYQAFSMPVVFMALASLLVIGAGTQLGMITRSSNKPTRTA